MPVFNQSRSRFIRLIFITAFLIILGQVFFLQVLSNKFGRLAKQNAILEKIVYPPRGLIFDRQHRIMVNNTVAYDLMVTPSQVKGIDTTFFCKLLNIDTADFNKKIRTAIFKNTAQKPSVFEMALSPKRLAPIQENLWHFQNAFYIQERPVRSYPFSAGANIFGYISEVDSAYLKTHENEGYVSGDYAGKTGLEERYEKTLTGERGVQYLIKDNFSRIQGSYENGALDKEAIGGSNLYTSMNIVLQQFGEKLMKNKVGSIVAIDPKTGGILCMVSSPSYDPSALTGAERKKNFNELFTDPRKPFLNRAVNATYSPGSTFKTLQALVGLHDGVITTQTVFSCSGAFYGCGSRRPMKCLDPGSFSLKTAITVSCNTYFADVMQRVINNPKYPGIDSSLHAWDNYMYGFGLGHKLGVDIPTEKKGNIPTPEYFNDPKVYGKGRWNFCNFRSVSIGQGEVLVTPLQVANEIAYIANKGWYYIPHFVDSVEGGDKTGMLDAFKKKVVPLEIPDSIFEAVHDGMQGVVEHGTGMGARIPGITICGKTGTVENYYKGVKQPNHSFFAAFAPRENPQIAIMCVVENSGRFGGTYAAPIVSLMIEKYLRDTLSKDRMDEAERFEKTDLIPPVMLAEMKKMDSLKKAREAGNEFNKTQINLKDTLQTEETPTVNEIKDSKASGQKPANNTPAGHPPKAETILPDSSIHKKTPGRDSGGTQK